VKHDMNTAYITQPQPLLTSITQFTCTFRLLSSTQFSWPRTSFGSVSFHKLLKILPVHFMGGAGGLAIRCWTCSHLDHGFESHCSHLGNNLGRVVHTYVPLSPSSITWYQLKDGDFFQLGN